MPILTNEMMRSIIMDHYSSPRNKREPKDSSYLKVHHSSDNCIDDIDVFIKIENDIIKDCCWTGVACTIATASTDIMCDLVIDKNKEEAYKILDNYFSMIYEKPYEEDLLDEANAFVNTSKQASRIRCATIGWNSLKDLLEEYNGKK